MSATALGFSLAMAAVPASIEAAPGAPAKAAPARSAKPNVLFILIDDLRPDLGVYGHPTAKTPNIDALGKSGIVFENAFVSQAVCGPSRAALLSGLRPDTSGITDLQTPVDKALPNAVTMLDLFKRAGYRTLGYGKVYHHLEDDADGWSVRTPDYEHETRKADRMAKVPRVAAARADDRSKLPDTLNVGLALKEMPKLAKSGQPFFMAVGIHRPHLPFISPKEDWARYSPATVPPPINPDGQKGAPPWALVSYEVWNYPDTKGLQPNMPKDKTDELRWAYLAAVSYADGLVGDLMTTLKQQGLDDNTIVVLWGDHGWKLGDHKAWAKHSTADIDNRVPLLIRAPGVTKPGARSAAMVETVDIYPTLAELANLTPPANLEGLSMRPLLGNPSRAWKTAAFSQYGRNGGLTGGRGPLTGYTVRTAAYRYTGWVDKSGKVAAQELYDLKADRNESTNVAANPSYKKMVTEAEAIRSGGWKKVRDAVK